MLKSLTAHFTGPICNCETNRVAIGVMSDGSFQFTCQQCKVFITIPWNKLPYNNSFDKKYPKYKCSKCNELHDTGLTHDQATIKDIIK